MSSTDVFPRRNLGAAEDWGRKVEDRTKGAEAGVESLQRQVEDLRAQFNSLSGTALPIFSRVPTPVFKSANTKSVSIGVAGQWVEFHRHGFAIPEGMKQAIITVSGTLQLTGTSATVDAPWVRVSGGYGESSYWWLPDSGGQGVRAASNPQAVYLATISAAITETFPAGATDLFVTLEGWSSSGTAFATPSASNLASLFVQVQFYPEPVASESA